MGRLPRGPTLSFQITEFSLMKDVSSFLLNPHPPSSSEYKTSPLLILNNFKEAKREEGEGKKKKKKKEEEEREEREREEKDKAIKLMSVTFQSLFPSLNLQKMTVADCKRAVLLSYDRENDCIYFRHYLLSLSVADISLPTRDLFLSSRKKITSLRDLNDISELFEDSSSPSSSSSSSSSSPSENTVTLCSSFFENPDLDPSLTRKKWKRRKIEKEKREKREKEEKEENFSLKLEELGPRMTLKLIKIEQDLFSGEVLFHSFVSKSEEEKEVLRQKVEEKEKRRKEQEKNVEKRKEREEREEREKREKKEERNGKEEEEEEGGYEEYEGYEDEDEDEEDEDDEDEDDEDEDEDEDDDDEMSE